MRTWLRCLAWRLVGFKLLPVKPGDLVILHVNDTDIDLNYFRAFATSVYARGAKLNVLPRDSELAIITDRASR